MTYELTIPYKERNRFEEVLRSIPFLRVIPSEANYFLCEVTERFTSSELAILLIKRENILIKDCCYKKAFAGKNSVGASALDGIGVGLGITASLVVIGLVREILGSGSAFGWKLFPGDGVLAFVMAPGAFLVLGYLMALFNKYLKK